MADHRGKRAATQSDRTLHVQPTPPSYVGKRRAALGTESPSTETVPAKPRLELSRSSYIGKRRAIPAPDAPATAPTSSAQQPDLVRDVAVEPITVAHVEPTPPVPAVAEPAVASEGTAHVGRRRARSAPQRHVGVSRLRHAPSRIGFVALAIAAAGAIGVGPGGVALASQNLQQYSAQANALTGVSTVVSAGTRQNSQSRSANRVPLAGGTTNNDLVRAAEQQAQEREAALSALAKNAQKYANYVAKNAWQLPIAAGHYVLTARFGEYGLWSGMHTGLDFAAPTGTPIVAVANGTVTFVGWDGAYGNKVVETLPNGTEIWYCHMSATAVHLGESIVGGQQVGNVGSTGHTTGPHLHLEVRPGAGDPVDPYQALVYHGVTP